MDELLDSSEAGGLRDLQDYSKCKLCRQRYRLPAAAWRTAVDAGERREVEQGQYRAARVAARAVAVAVNRSSMLAAWAEEMVELVVGDADVSPSCATAIKLSPLAQRQAYSGAIIAGGLTAWLLDDRAEAGGWEAVRQRDSWQQAKRMAATALAVAVTVWMQLLCAVGPPARDAPAGSWLLLADQLAEGVALAARLVFVFQATTTCRPVAFLLPLLRTLTRRSLRPAEAGGQAFLPMLRGPGMYVLDEWWGRHTGATVHQLFKLRRLHAALSRSRLLRVLNRLGFWRAARLPGLPSWQGVTLYVVCLWSITEPSHTVMHAGCRWKTNGWEEREYRQHENWE